MYLSLVRNFEKSSNMVKNKWRKAFNPFFGWIGTLPSTFRPPFLSELPSINFSSNSSCSWLSCLKSCRRCCCFNSIQWPENRKIVPWKYACVLWFPFFSHFHFSWKTKNFELKKNSTQKIVKVAFFSTNFAQNINFWLVKISGHSFSSFFTKFLPFFKLECAEDFSKSSESSKMAKNWPKMKKIDFSFFVFRHPFFAEKRKFSFFVGHQSP